MGNRTLIAGLSCDGIVAPWVISGALDRDAFDQLIKAIGNICDLFTPDQCRNFFQAAGYAS